MPNTYRDTSSDMLGKQLKSRILDALTAQGFRVQGGRLCVPQGLDKAGVRALHKEAVERRLKRFEGALSSYESRLLKRIAAGREVAPKRIKPRLVQVRRGSEDELLFRYAGLHWSIPVSSGYGRRVRFLVIDEQNEKLIGLFGIGDPVFNLGPRDDWVGWTRKARRDNLRHVVDAFVLGAVPPYSALLCGKLVAMLTTSTQVRDAFRRKYRRNRSRIRRRVSDGRVALITTTSALGRSSIYNRLKYKGRTLFYPVGFTRGSGEFHFSNGLYDALIAYAAKNLIPTAKHTRWGTGFRNRREVIKKCLADAGISPEWAYHGIRREIFAAPLARNSREFLQGEHSKLMWYHEPACDLFEWFRDRWLLPRAGRDDRYCSFNPESYRLWVRSQQRGHAD